MREILLLSRDFNLGVSMRYSGPKTAARYNPARSRQGPAEVTRTFQQILSLQAPDTLPRDSGEVAHFCCFASRAASLCSMSFVSSIRTWLASSARIWLA